MMPGVCARVSSGEMQIVDAVEQIGVMLDFV